MKDEELILACKKCKKVFKVHSSNFEEEADGFCPGCDNKWFIEAVDPNAGK